MANWMGYFGIENIALNVAQKLVIWETLRALGSPSQPLPNLQMQFRIRPDLNAALFEAEFRREQLSTDWFRNGLALIFDVSVDHIMADAVNITLDERPTPVVTFSYNSIPMLRMALFGGLDATWRESWVECTAYMAANRAKWEPL